MNNTRKPIPTKRAIRSKVLHSLGATRVRTLNAATIRYSAEQLHQQLCANRTGVNVGSVLVGLLAFVLLAMRDEAALGLICGAVLTLGIFFLCPTPLPTHFSIDEGNLVRLWIKDRRMLMRSREFKILCRDLHDRRDRLEPDQLHSYEDCVRLMFALHHHRTGLRRAFL